MFRKIKWLPLVLAALFIAACTAEPPPPTDFVTVTFSPNGGEGSAPAITGEIEAEIQLPFATGIYKSGHIFGGWNTQADGKGTNYNAGDSFTMPSGNITLYAKWVLIYKEYPIEEGTFSSGALGTSFTGFRKIDNISNYYKDNFDIASLYMNGYTSVTLRYIYTINVWGDIEYEIRFHNVPKNKTLAFKPAEKLNGDSKLFSRDIECTVNLSELENSQVFETLEIQSSFRIQNLLWGGDFKILNRRVSVTFSRQ